MTRREKKNEITMVLLMNRHRL